MQARIRYATLDPEARKALLGLEDYLEHCSLELSLVDLIRLRVSQINECAFCLDMHIKDARASGETDERLFIPLLSVRDKIVGKDKGIEIGFRP